MSIAASWSRASGSSLHSLLRERPPRPSHPSPRSSAEKLEAREKGLFLGAHGYCCPELVTENEEIAGKVLGS